VLSGTKQVLQAALALPGEELSHLLDALIAADRYRRAEWVLIVREPLERCLESIPCQHSWLFSVERVLKGEGVPEEIAIYGRYRDHGAIPACLRLAPGDGNYILFLPAAAGDASTMLGVMPWSEQAEAFLTGREDAIQ
jgi:hypothetical protein